jgi:putative membrane protein
MIPRFTDYAANERTYLAWVRTAIAIMAFGFLVERFDLFLAYLGRGAGAPAAVSSAHRLHGAQLVGLALIALGIVIIIGATLRYMHHRRTIGSDEPFDYGTVLGDGLLALLLICLATFLGVYVYQQLMTLT